MNSDSRLRAIIADDTPVMIDLLTETLRQLDVDVVATAADGTAAEQLLKETDADIAFLDIEMPGQSGLDLLGKVREAGLDIFCVIVSGQSSFDTLKQAMDLGAGGYVVKPFSAQKISQMLDTYHRKRGAA